MDHPPAMFKSISPRTSTLRGREASYDSDTTCSTWRRWFLVDGPQRIIVLFIEAALLATAFFVLYKNVVLANPDTGLFGGSHEPAAPDSVDGTTRSSAPSSSAIVSDPSTLTGAGMFRETSAPSTAPSAFSSPPSSVAAADSPETKLIAGASDPTSTPITGWTPDTHVDAAAGNLYLLGTGKADITGPVVELNMMGYADPDQVATGLRQRLYARAFIVGAIDKPDERFVYLVLDTQSGDTAVRYGVLRELAALGPEYAAYGHHNVAITGTHSHSGPGAWLNYLLPQITSKGFDKQSFQAIVSGTSLAIQRAHQSLEPGRLSVGVTKVKGANVNRSLFAYLANPEAERASYNISAEDDGSVEKDLTLLRFQRASDDKNIGVLTWFPTHGTSMLGNNTLITGDNKGVAARLLEKSVEWQDHTAPGFVAGFSQASVGDTSPNVLGAWCDDGSGDQCSFDKSTCKDGKSTFCHGRGPFFREKDNGAKSCFEVGRRQHVASRSLYDDMNRGRGQGALHIRGPPVKAFHVFHDMSDFQFELLNGTEVRTCPAALGYSFAAGTSDGPGVFDFTQHGSNSSNTSPVWKVVSGFLKKPNAAQVACQAPKPILLDVGEVSKPYQWAPNIVDVQALRVGQLFIVVSPGEATTMAGRRWKSAVENAAGALLQSEGSQLQPIVVLGGPANSYTHYITTQEEYRLVSDSRGFKGRLACARTHVLLIS